MKTFGAVFLLTLSALLGTSPLACAALLLDHAGGTILWSDDADYDDEMMDGRTIGFEFTFFDEPFTELAVSTNGNLNFAADSSYANERSPSDVQRICPLWDDLEVLLGKGDAVIEKVSPGVYYSVTWRVHEASKPTTRHVFQVVLFGAAVRLAGFDFKPGDIVFSYDEIGTTFSKGTATVGLDYGDEGTIVALPNLDTETGLLTRSSAGMLPVGAGFVLYRLDLDLGEYTAMTITNRAPVAEDDSRYTLGTAPVEIPVLANDSDPEGDALTVTTVTQGNFGTVQVMPSGRVRYLPGPGFAGSDIFTYSIRDTHGLAQTARVVLLPRAAAKGVYDGLVTDAIPEGEVEPTLTNEGSGALRITLGAGGSFTGSLVYGGITHPLRGAFDADGNYAASILRTVDEEPEIVALDLHLNAIADVAQITGSVSDGVNVSVLAAGRSRFAAKTFPAPAAGRYTALFPLTEDSDGPGGIGFARMRVGRSGGVTLTGVLGDGTPFSVGSFVRLDGTLPISLRLRAAGVERAGSLSGTLRFRDVPGDSDCAGLLQWFFPATEDAVYSETTLRFTAARYQPPLTGERALALADTRPNAVLDLAGGEATALGTLTKTNTVLVEEPTIDGLAVRIRTATGLFSGKFFEEDFDTGARVKRTFRGALQQKMKRAGGLFVRDGESGAVTLAAPEPEEF